MPDNEWTILRTLNDPKLFAPWFSGETWMAWRTVLAALFALSMTPRQRRMYEQCTGRARLPETPFREAALVVGRRGGKSFVLALIAIYLAAFHDYRGFLAPGETPIVAIIAADRKQARVILRYIVGLMSGVRMLQPMIARETAESVTLSTGVVVEIHTGSIASPRGRTFAAVLADEIAFWSRDDSANPDVDVISAVRPGLITIPTSMLLMASSPYAKRGVLRTSFRKHYGKDGKVLVWKAPTWTMNPRIPRESLDDEFEDDPIAAGAEFGAEFRSDLESFVSREIIDACTGSDYELPPANDISYSAFVDPSGGASDSMTLAIAHRGPGDIGVLDAVRERKPPFSPESVVVEFCQLLKSYNIREVTGDRYGGESPRERFREHGIAYELADKPKFDLYREALPLLNSRRVQLLDIRHLQNQLAGLERRTARGGRDSIDHAPGSHDDVANSVCGVLVKTVGKLDSLAVWAKLAG